MLIHAENGRIELSPELTLYSQLTPQLLDEKTNLALWEKIRDRVMNPDSKFQTWRRTFVDYLTRKVVVDVTFHNDKLWTVELSFFLDFETSARLHTVDHISTRQKRQDYHQEVLYCLLNNSPHGYSWGYVTLGSCSYDHFPTIIIVYGFARPST